MKKGWILFSLIIIVSLAIVFGIKPETTLQTGEIEYDEEFNTYTVEFHELGDYRELAGVYVRLTPLGYGRFELLISYTHRPDETKIRSLELNFKRGQFSPHVYLNASTYASSPASYFSNDGQTLTLQIPDLGPLGIGTYEQEFYLNSRSSQERELELGIHMVLRPARSIFPGSQNARVTINLQLPEE